MSTHTIVDPWTARVWAALVCWYSFFFSINITVCPLSPGFHILLIDKLQIENSFPVTSEAWWCEWSPWTLPSKLQQVEQYNPIRISTLTHNTSERSETFEGPWNIWRANPGEQGRREGRRAEMGATDAAQNSLQDIERGEE